jgi:hypothetical protein
MEQKFLRGEFSSRVDIRIVKSSCPQKEINRKIWHLNPGTKVRLYVGNVKPSLPLPFLSTLLYPEIWEYELDIEVIASDNETQTQWEYFRELSLTRGRK